MNTYRVSIDDSEINVIHTKARHHIDAARNVVFGSFKKPKVVDWRLSAVGGTEWIIEFERTVPHSSEKDTRTVRAYVSMPASNGHLIGSAT